MLGTLLIVGIDVCDIAYADIPSDSRTWTAAALPTESCPNCGSPIDTASPPLMVTYKWSDGRTLVFRLARDEDRAYGQLYTASGHPRGNEISVDISGSGGLLPVVMPYSDGSFELSWRRGQGENLRVYQQRYDADGLPVGKAVLRNP
jgi:hypothetical protein